MSDKNDFFNLDDILADFSSYSNNIINGEQPSQKPETPAKPAADSRRNSSSDFTASGYSQDDISFDSFLNSQQYKADKSVPEFSFDTVPSGRNSAPASFDFSQDNAPAFESPVFDFSDAPAARPVNASNPRTPAQPPRRPVRRNAQNPNQRSANAASADATVRAEFPRRNDVQRNPRHAAMPNAGADSTNVRPSQPGRYPQGQRHAAPAPASRPSSHAKAAPAVSQAKAYASSVIENRGLLGILGIVFSVISIFVLSWVFVNVHPDSGTAVGNALKSKVNMVEKFNNYANNAASDALGELAYIPKIYTIAEDVNVAPKPNPANFGSTTDPQVILKVIEDASALLGDQKVAFDPNANFIPGSEIKYYRDDTILAIAWKEDISGKCCSCAEVKIAHGSQIRRKVAGDTYSVGKRYYATDMAKECNAVVAINGDFYDFRPIGITVFQRELFRFNPGKLDSCHITANGDFLFTYADELTDEESTRQFIKDNDIIFSLSFGPILIDNGELRPVTGYPIGEVNTTYSRSAIGLLDNLHYMMMTVNYDVGYTTAATLNEIGGFMAGKGCQKAYALDGGQTSVLMMNGELVNHVDYGNERTMSDIIYFATAIPEEEAAK